MTEKRMNGDTFNAQQRLRCTAWTACLRCGPFESYRMEASSEADALDKAKRLTAAYASNGRKALVYGITPERWTVHIGSSDGLLP